MLSQIKLENTLCLDIETVPQYSNFNEMPEELQYLWEKKSSYLRKEEETAENVYNRAGIYAEFGKIICISIGIFDFRNNKRQLRLKSFYGHDENKILVDLIQILNKFNTKRQITLCAHNGKEFDFPYIARRILINNIKLPDVLDLAGKRPWETNFLDTMELWKFGDYKHFTSLELLTTIFKITNPKDDIDGSMIAGLYWEEKNFERIVTYCEKDVTAIAQLLLRYKGENLIENKNILILKD